jgi:hypothetical protein
MIPSHSRIGGILLVVLCAAPSAWAWGHEGHRIVGRIAARHLTPATRTKVAAILGTNDAGVETAMAAAATWPDEIDKKKTGTDLWHFIDVPVTAPFSIAGLCTAHNCVLDRIAEMESRLAMNTKGFTLATPPSPPRPMTSQELAFLIHFVGDVHQPLHAANDGDRGGNCVGLVHPLMHSDGTQTTEIHAVWDDDEVRATAQSLGSENAIVTALFQRFKSGASIPQLTPTDWAHETNDLARRDVYQKLHLPNHTAPQGQCATGIAKVNVGKPYLAGNVADVETQLLRAGIRLSNVLNQICAGNGCSAKP